MNKQTKFKLSITVKAPVGGRKVTVLNRLNDMLKQDPDHFEIIELNEEEHTLYINYTE